MKKSVLKIGSCAVAVAIAGILAFELVANREMEVNASGSTLPGIESMRSNILQTDSAFQVLEIVPDRSLAEFGYLVGGSEPLFYSQDTVNMATQHLTYADCSLWDEANRVWLSVEQKLASFGEDEQKKVEFMQFIISEYNKKVSVNPEIRNLLQAPSDVSFVKGDITYVGTGGNFAVALRSVEADTVPVPSDGVQYFTPQLDLVSDLSDVDLDPASNTSVYYKRISHYITEEDGTQTLYDAYEYVGTIDKVIEDIGDITREYDPCVVASDSDFSDGTLQARTTLVGVFMESIKAIDPEYEVILGISTADGQYLEETYQITRETPAANQYVTMEVNALESDYLDITAVSADAVNAVKYVDVRLTNPESLQLTGASGVYHYVCNNTTENDLLSPLYESANGVSEAWYSSEETLTQEQIRLVLASFSVFIAEDGSYILPEGAALTQEGIIVLADGTRLNPVTGKIVTQEASQEASQESSLGEDPQTNDVLYPFGISNTLKEVFEQYGIQVRVAENGTDVSIVLPEGASLDAATGTVTLQDGTTIAYDGTVTTSSGATKQPESVVKTVVTLTIEDGLTQEQIQLLTAMGVTISEDGTKLTLPENVTFDAASKTVNKGSESIALNGNVVESTTYVPTNTGSDTTGSNTTDSDTTGSDTTGSNTGNSGTTGSGTDNIILDGDNNSTGNNGGSNGDPNTGSDANGNTSNGNASSGNISNENSVNGNSNANNGNSDSSGNEGSNPDTSNTNTSNTDISNTDTSNTSNRENSFGDSTTSAKKNATEKIADAVLGKAMVTKAAETPDASNINTLARYYKLTYQVIQPELDAGGAMVYTGFDANIQSVNAQIKQFYAGQEKEVEFANRNGERLFYKVDTTQTVTDGSGNFYFTENENGNYVSKAGEGYGSFTNTEAFRSGVFDLSKDDYEKFGVKVTSLTPYEVGELTAVQIANYDLIYISNGTLVGKVYENQFNYQSAYSYQNDFASTGKMGNVFATIVSQNIPVVIDSSVVATRNTTTGGSNLLEVKADATSTNTALYKMAVLLLQEDYSSYVNSDGSAFASYDTYQYTELAKNAFANMADPDTDFNFVNKNVLSYFDYYTSEIDGQKTSIVNGKFTQTGICTSTVTATGFEKVLSEIETENMYRAADKGANYEQLDTGISFARALRYAINYTYQRIEVLKTSLRILEIQPANATTEAGKDELTKAMVSEWVDGQIAADDAHIVIDTMTITEFIGHIDDINTKYDLVYIGSDVSSFQSTGHFSTGNGEFTNGADFVSQNVTLCLYNFKTKEWDYVNANDIGTDYICHQYWPYTTNVMDVWGRHVYANCNYGAEKVTTTENGTSAAYANVENCKLLNTTMYNGTMVSYVSDADLAKLSASYRYAGSGLYEGPNYNDSSMNGMIYTNIGDVVPGNQSINGMLANEWNTGVINQNNQSNIVSNAWHRYTGTDLTGEKYNALMDFADASYPIVISDALYMKDDKGNRIVNSYAVDNSSYMYDFLNTTLGYSNVVSVSDIAAGDSKLFNFYINKPKLTLSITGYGPYDKIDNSDNSGGQVHNLSANLGKYYLTYTFVITNNGAVSNDSLYTAKLFLDSNADGKFSELYEELEGLTITYSGNGGESVTVPYNQLKAGVTYTATRQLPANYNGVLTWCLRVEQNSNTMLRSAQQGYTKLVTEDPPAEIKILQIMNANNNSLNLETAVGQMNDTNVNGKNDLYKIYHSLVYGDGGKDVKLSNGQVIDVSSTGISDDYILNITSIYCNDYMTQFNNAENEDGTNNYLDDYDMLILGFSDMYQDIYGEPLTGEGGLLDFVESGKSVLFAHDTTGFYEFLYNGNNQQNTWAAYLTPYIRFYAGMDTYGVKVAETDILKGADTQKYKELTTGNPIKSGTELWNELFPTKTDGRYTYNSKSIAFKPGSARTAAVGEVQGHTYYTTTRFRGSNTTKEVNGVKYTGTYYYRKDAAKICNPSSTTVTKVNDGQITSYPYKLPATLTVPKTHGQYFSLDMNADDDDDNETDVVVWYCLNGGDSSSGNFYGASYNDTQNNYYIYNKGNVTYTGVGHSGATTTVEEAKLFINTMVAAYNAGTKNIDVSILDSEMKKTESLYEYNDEENDISFSDDLQKVYFTMNDPNIVQGTKNLKVNFYLYKTGTAQTPDTIVSNGVTYTLKDTEIAVSAEEATTSTRTEMISLEISANINTNKTSDYYLRVKDKNNKEAYVSIDKLLDTSTKEAAKYRCNATGSSYGKKNNYVKAYNWSKGYWEIMQMETWSWSNSTGRLHVYVYGTVSTSALQVVELTDLVVHQQSDGSVVDSSKLESDVCYYVELPIDTLKANGIIAKADSRNKFYICGTPMYTTINKLTHVERVKEGNPIYSKVNFITIGIFDLD